MNKPLRIALTGNIGCGKSYVALLFRGKGIPVFDSDREAKLLYLRPEVKARMVERFGDECYHADGSLNRGRLASLLFSDPEALAFVEQTLYPVLNSWFAEWADRQEAPFVLYESALIFEKHLESMFDAVVVVTASDDTRLRRVMLRDHCSEAQVRQRMALQLPETEKALRGDFVILHDEDDEDAFLTAQVEEVISNVLRFSKPV